MSWLMRRRWELCGLKSAAERPAFNEPHNSPEVRDSSSSRGSARLDDDGKEKDEQHRSRNARWAADPHNRFLAAQGWLDSIRNGIDSLLAEDVNGIPAEDASELDAVIRALVKRLDVYRDGIAQEVAA